MTKYLNSRSIAVGLIFAFLANTMGPSLNVQAQEIHLPAPGQMLALSPAYNPAVLKGIKLDAQDPFHFDFFIDTGDSHMSSPNASVGDLKQESAKLIKYFLASLTIPENDLWVNLSPYEKTRIVPEEFGKTEMGRDLLAEDYILKQITASLIYPEDKLGKEFWAKIYAEAKSKYGTTNIPVNTFNKVWIVPDKAVVYENGGTAFVLENHLKVMLEEDYLSLSKHGRTQGPPLQNNVNVLGSQIVREIVIPALTKEVNEGKNFSQLRQVFYSLILATWYKKKIKESILNKIYSNRNKIQNLSSPNASVGDPQYIYQQYLKAFKKGVFNYIKDEPDPLNNQTIPRKYFSGGVQAGEEAKTISTVGKANINFALSRLKTPRMLDLGVHLTWIPAATPHANAAMIIPISGENRTFVYDLLSTNPRSVLQKILAYTPPGTFVLQQTGYILKRGLYSFPEEAPKTESSQFEPNKGLTVQLFNHKKTNISFDSHSSKVTLESDYLDEGQLNGLWATIMGTAPHANSAMIITLSEEKRAFVYDLLTTNPRSVLQKILAYTPPGAFVFQQTGYIAGRGLYSFPEEAPKTESFQFDPIQGLTVQLFNGKKTSVSLHTNRMTLESDYLDGPQLNGLWGMIIGKVNKPMEPMTKWERNRAMISIKGLRDHGRSVSKAMTTLDKKKVLLVDDGDDDIFLTEYALSKQGAIVTTVKGVNRALEAKPDDYALILSDYQMPGKDGIELLKELKSRNIKIPVIILSGRTDILSGALKQNGFENIPYLEKISDYGHQVEKIREIFSRIQGKSPFDPAMPSDPKNKWDNPEIPKWQNIISMKSLELFNDQWHVKYLNWLEINHIPADHLSAHILNLIALWSRQRDGENLKHLLIRFLSSNMSPEEQNKLYSSLMQLAKIPAIRPYVYYVLAFWFRSQNHLSKDVVRQSITALMAVSYPGTPYYRQAIQALAYVVRFHQQEIPDDLKEQMITTLKDRLDERLKDTRIGAAFILGHFNNEELFQEIEHNLTVQLGRLLYVNSESNEDLIFARYNPQQLENLGHVFGALLAFRLQQMAKGIDQTVDPLFIPISAGAEGEPFNLEWATTPDGRVTFSPEDRNIFEARTPKFHSKKALREFINRFNDLTEVFSRQTSLYSSLHISVAIPEKPQDDKIELLASLSESWSFAGNPIDRDRHYYHTQEGVAIKESPVLRIETRTSCIKWDQDIDYIVERPDWMAWADAQNIGTLKELNEKTKSIFKELDEKIESIFDVLDFGVTNWRHSKYVQGNNLSLKEIKSYYEKKKQARQAIMQLMAEYIKKFPDSEAMMSKTGGIDLNPAQMSLETTTGGDTFKFKWNDTTFDAAQVSGASFTIQSMSRVTNLPQILSGQ